MDLRLPESVLLVVRATKRADIHEAFLRLRCALIGRCFPEGSLVAGLIRSAAMNGFACASTIACLRIIPLPVPSSLRLTDSLVPIQMVGRPQCDS
jgi:hypothetical protein